uniref:Uncharacterized protein n=1 Tax=Meloidogyne floridensis TaxID=298350 RepID=A0A915NGU6_9BILA
MIKILIPAFITFLHFCAPTDGSRFFLKIKGVVSNGNDYERIDNHEYHEFCVHMKCITTREVYRVIKRRGGNIINDEFYLKNNRQLKIVTPNNCDLNEPITFHVTHLFNGYCFADGGVHAPSNYENWVCNHFVPAHHTSSDTDTSGEREGNRFYLKINGVVSNANVDERVDNHEYHQFCVHMKCIEGLNIHGNNRVIERQGDNIINEEFYVQNNHELPIDAPEFCNLDLAITFHVTHVVNRHCFANGGVHEPSNYDDWPQFITRIEKYENTDDVEGTVALQYLTEHSVIDANQPDPQPSESETNGQGETSGSGHNGSEYSGSD